MGSEVLKHYGNLDVLYYYLRVGKKLRKFLKGREIATKIYLPNGVFFLVRGSKKKPLFIHDFEFISDWLLKLRAKNGLSDVKEQLGEKEILIWQYFVPRKLIDFFYACNGEFPGQTMDRVFIDIDRKNNSAEDARKVTAELVKLIKNDREFSKLIKFKIFIMWTGSSFHVYLLLNRKINLEFYNKYLSYGKEKENKNESFIMKWAGEISKKLKINVKAGHEKQENAITLDSSNTPSGKLARAPFSLHINKKKNEVDGVAVPVSQAELEDKNLIKKLYQITPEKVLKNLEKYGKLIPI